MAERAVLSRPLQDSSIDRASLNAHLHQRLYAVSPHPSQKRLDYDGRRNHRTLSPVVSLRTSLAKRKTTGTPPSLQHLEDRENVPTMPHQREREQVAADSELHPV